MSGPDLSQVRALSQAAREIDEDAALKEAVARQRRLWFDELVRMEVTPARRDELIAQLRALEGTLDQIKAMRSDYPMAQRNQRHG
jgi:uncharacterized protein involved in exopolysaccharide biosynthesis